MSSSKPVSPLPFKDRSEWRAWLEANHSQNVGAWIFIRKKGARGQGMAYDEAVEEALCFGWIDGQMKSVDKEKYALRFSPRKPRSIWSKSNTTRAERLVREGRMAPAGLQRIDEAKKDGRWDAAYSSKDIVEIPTDLEAVLEQDPDAKEHFLRFPNSTRIQYIYWIEKAKNRETRLKRIKETALRAHRNLKPGDPI